MDNNGNHNIMRKLIFIILNPIKELNRNLNVFTRNQGVTSLPHLERTSSSKSSLIGNYRTNRTQDESAFTFAHVSATFGERPPSLCWRYFRIWPLIRKEGYEYRTCVTTRNNGNNISAQTFLTVPRDPFYKNRNTPTLHMWNWDTGLGSVRSTAYDWEHPLPH